MPSNVGKLKRTLLSSFRKKILEDIFANQWIRDNFYLTGGTALAEYYYRHRISDDLDFFTHQEIDLQGVVKIVEELRKKILFEIINIEKSPHFIRYIIAKEGETLKLDFVKDLPLRFGIPHLKKGIIVDCLENIAVNKVCAILGRLEVKDYIDLYFILTKEKIDIFSLIEMGQAKDGGLNRFQWASLISDVKNFKELPKMVVPLKLEILQEFFLSLRDKILDSLKPASLA